MSAPSEPILIVDDDPHLVRVVEAVLRDGGYRVVSTREPERVPEMLRGQRPCLVVLDLDMPGKDGLDVLHEIRRKSDAPVLMLTGMDRAEKAVAALKAGAYDYLVKPVDSGRLLRTVELALATRASRDDSARIAQYVLGRELGRGGMGIVYEARDLVLERDVAIKVLHPELALDSGYEAGLLKEARAVAALSHPGIVTVYTAGRDRGRLFIAMERIEGRSLKDLFRSGNPFGVSDAARIGRDVADALAAAHRTGLVHGDIKPSNLMIPAGGGIKIVDFGLARRGAAEQGRSSEESTFKGTLSYASPEQIQGLPVDRRADVYSLGVVLYELLTGRRAFEGRNLFQLSMKIIRGETPFRIEQDGRLPRSLVDLVRKMMAVDPAERPGSAEEVRSGLDAILQNISS